MKERTTIKQLEAKLGQINQIIPGHELDNAYGGYRLWRDGSAKFGGGYVSKSVLFDLMEAYRQGIEIGKK